MDGPLTTYRVVVSREDPWWTAVAYGDGLPPHGAATETRTIADLEDKIRDLIVLRTDADMRLPYDKAVHTFDLDWRYDLPQEAADALRDYQKSKRELAEAQDRYAVRAEQAAAALTDSVHASVRDVAALMGISYQRVSQLLATLRRRIAAAADPKTARRLGGDRNGPLHRNHHQEVGPDRTGRPGGRRVLRAVPVLAAPVRDDTQRGAPASVLGG